MRPCQGAPERSAATKRRSSDIRFNLAALAAALTLTAAPAEAHRPGCFTSRCDRRADILYARHNRPRFHVGLFERCVFNRESGTGASGPWTLSTIRWDYDDGTHEGAANWLNSTWRAMGGGRYSPAADEATPEQQTLIFRAHATEPGQWDETVPPCLKYRGLP